MLFQGFETHPFQLVRTRKVLASMRRTSAVILPKFHAYMLTCVAAVLHSKLLNVTHLYIHLGMVVTAGTEGDEFPQLLWNRFHPFPKCEFAQNGLQSLHMLPGIRASIISFSRVSARPFKLSNRQVNKSTGTTKLEE